MGKTFPLTKSENMGIFTPQRKIKSSYNLLKDFDYYLPDIKGLFILLALLIAGALLGNLVTAGLMLLPGGEGLMSYSMLLSYPVMFIPAMLYAASKSKFNRDFDMERPVPVDQDKFGIGGFLGLAAAVVIVTIAAGFVTDPLSKLLPPTPEWFDRLNEQMLVGTPLWATLLSVSVFAPLFEEWLCRGMILRGLLQRMKPIWAMVISSLFFALIHMNPWQALPAFILGMLFAYVYYRTGSLKLTMLMHCANNTFAALIGQNDKFREMTSYSEIMEPWQYVTLVIAGLFITVVFILILRKNTTVGNQPMNL